MIHFEDLKTADLVIDATYSGGSTNTFADDPISQLLITENQGGIRKRGTFANLNFKINSLVLISNLSDLDWPDFLEETTGILTYFGDNKEPGRELHETPKLGNKILRHLFDSLHLGRRSEIPPIFVFTKAGKGRDVMFRGLAVPGSATISPYDDLVAVWKSKDGQRFQNYRAIFSILDVHQISREWINDLDKGNIFTVNAPEVWKKWVEKGIYKNLRSEISVSYRTKQDQLPNSKNDLEVLNNINDYYKDKPYEFEKFAAELFRMMDSNVSRIDVTRPWRDGGRDAIGRYKIGLVNDGIEVEFALEAKLYSLNNGVGIKHTSRLISRIKNRQFGVLVTTSFVSTQALKEIKEDNHPILCIPGKDIVFVLKSHGIDTPEKCLTFLKYNYPLSIG